MARSKRPSALELLQQNAGDIRRFGEFTSADESPAMAEAATTAPVPASPTEPAPVRQIPIVAIRIREGFNARRTLTDDDPALDDLKASLADSGLLEPIVVRPAPDQIEHYELIAGERRFRFARSLGWSTILAHVIPMTDEQAAANNLLENLQREDLSLLEQADAYDRLMTTFGWSQNEVAKRLKVRSSYISSVRKVARIPRLRDGITAETLKGRVARELGRLVDAGGTERVPGALDLFLRWVALRDPTMAVVQARVDECLATGRVPASVAQASEPLSQPLVRRSWAEIQWERWERRDRPYVLQASLVELQEAESRVATILSDIQQAIQTRTGTVSPAASVTPDPNPSKAGGPSARS